MPEPVEESRSFRPPAWPAGLRRLGGNLLALSLSLGLIALLFQWRFETFRSSRQGYEAIASESYRTRDFAPLTEAQVTQLGRAHSQLHRPPSSYAETSRAKPEGTFRIGLFGCSFLEGAEAALGFDLGTLLQEHFTDAGYGRVEVVNFGVGGYGVHQAAKLWDMVGRDYDLDVTLFYLWSFHRGRDDTFLHRPEQYLPVHGRYVVENDDLRWIEVVGNSREEAADIYHRPLPPWRYLRYDSKAPVFLRALLPPGRELRRNPFYHRSNPDGELDETYARLLERVAAGSERVVVMCNDDDICSFRGQVRADNIHFSAGRSDFAASHLSSLYRAPRKHLGGLGNDLAALEVFNLLTGGAPDRLPVLRLRPGLEPPPTLGTPRPLHTFDRVLVGERAWKAGRFVTPGGDPVDLRERGISALLDVSSPNELRFVGLPEPLVPGAPLTLRVHRGEPPFQVPLGTVEGGGVLGRISQSDAVDAGGRTWRLDIGGSPALEVSGPGAFAPADILLDGRPILRTRADPEPATPGEPAGLRLELEPTEGPFLEVRAVRDQRLRTAAPQGVEWLYLHLKDEGVRSVRVPITAYVLADTLLPASGPPLPWRIPKDDVPSTDESP
ncbi:MAG: hypothetical protein AAGN66_13430 [Acidobacteriota bacterium]